MKTAAKYPDQVSKRERGSGARVCQRSSEACHKVERQENENQNKNVEFLPFFDIYIYICLPDLSRANARRRKLQRQQASGKTRIILMRGHVYIIHR